MGRKSAPQPLALDGNPPTTNHQAQPSPSSNLRTAETASSGQSSAVSTTSPRLSPFSRPFLSKLRASPTAQSSLESPALDDSSQLPPNQSHFDPPTSPRSTQTVTTVDHPKSNPRTQARRFLSHFKGASQGANDFLAPVHYRSGSRGHTQLLKGHGSTATKHRVGKPPPLGSAASAPSQVGSLNTTVVNLRPSSSPLSAHRIQTKPSGVTTQTKSVDSLDKRGAESPLVLESAINIMSSAPTSRSSSPPVRAGAPAPEALSRDTMDPSSRNRSQDRMPSRDRDHRGPSPSHRENGATFLSGLRNTGTRAAGMLISKGLFGKGTKVGSTFDKELPPVVDDEHYMPKVLHLPLVEQARRTRISKRLEDARDKTEFWMPAFPWRAIDYLNYKGCEVEGLYRVPGSGPQIKKWQRRFDEEHDLDLFHQDDLYDINIIGSMLKAWLRELPDEIFPKAAQERISRQCAGAETVPELLIEELSNLSPFNYYLLFAITCHLSLLLAHSDKNKMNFQNLCICFQPCMKIDAFCFKFLVCDWRDCWQGCKNEAQYIEDEYKLLDKPPPPGLIESQVAPQGEEQVKEKPPAKPRVERQGSSSSVGSKPSQQENAEQQPGRLNRKRLQVSESNGSIGSKDSSISTTLTAPSERDRDPPKGAADIRRLSPIQPLSPMGFQ